jgi:hypothetical protein
MFVGFAIHAVWTIRKDLSQPLIDVIPECPELCKNFGLVLPELGRTDKMTLVQIKPGRE